MAFPPFVSPLTLLKLRTPAPQATRPDGPAYSMSDIGGMQNLFGSLQTKSGRVVTPAAAMRAAFVLACIRILTEDVSALPINFYRDIEGGPKQDWQYPVHRLLNIIPNAIQTPMELRERIMLDFLLHGKFYVLKDGESEITDLWPLNVESVSRRGNVYPFMWDYSDPIRDQNGTFTADTVWRGSILSDANFDGRSIIMLCREAVGLLLAAEEQGARLFAHGIQSDLALSTPDNLDTDQRDQLTARLYAAYAGTRNSFMPMLLEGGLTANRIGLTAEESQYIESRKFQGEDIARMFRIPGVMLGIGDKTSTFASAEQFFLAYIKFTLAPWANRIEQTIVRDLIPSAEWGLVYPKHDFRSLQKGERYARYQAYEIGIRSKFLSGNEVREEEDLPNVPGLDNYDGLPTAAPAGGAPPTPPADKSGALAQRVAVQIVRREQKSLTAGGKYKNADLFYALHAGFVEDLTGGDPARILEYCQGRLESPDRFSSAAQADAISALVGLCKKDK